MDLKIQSSNSIGNIKEMKDRIKEYMDYKSIAAGELANILEVQRSNISHVLNGRNKPGASFIEKLLISFPDLNARWLMTGEGEMIFNSVDSEYKVEEPAKKITEQFEKQVNYSEPKNSGKLIDKVVVLYSDGTFADYNKK